MSQERNGDLGGQHRLFHAMVLMGGSIALGCGGMSAGTADDDGGTGGTGSLSGAGNAGTSAAGTGGAASSSGGASTGGTGGAIVLPPIAGTSSVDPDPPNCPPAQWSCSDPAQSCFGDTYGLPAGCACDEARPLAPSDCPAGTVFACHAGGRAPDGTALPQVVPFSCSCVPDSQNCDAECVAAAPSSGTCTDVHTSNGRSVLCNCAVIVLR